MPPLAASPWQAEHFSAKTLAPCAGVPLPGGRLVPSGRTAISHCLMSLSVSGLPRPASCAAAALAVSAKARADAARILGIDMFDRSRAVDRPAGDAVVVLIGESERGRNRSTRFAAHGHKIRAQRLHVAAVVIGATLQDCRLAIPAPRHDKPRECLVVNRALQRRLAPAFAAVGR